MEVYTIGFTKKSAAEFFRTLTQVGAKRVMDIRLNNSSQLAGFTKRDDLAYFLKEICNAEYQHEPLLAPTREIRDAFAKRKGSWEAYERDFLALLSERKVEERLDPNSFSGPTVLLCAEEKADHCHRRLVAEYLRGKWGDFKIVHL